MALAASGASAHERKAMTARAMVEEALRRLGVKRLLLSIQDPSFPAADGEDLGRGTPYDRGGLALLRFAHTLGFDAIQLGPCGQTTRSNPSPYDASVFGRNTASVGLSTLAEDPRYGHLVDPERLAERVASTPTSGAADRYRHAFDTRRDALTRAAVAHRRSRTSGEARARAIDAELAEFRRAHDSWLVPYALHAWLAERHASADHERWPADDRDLYARGSAEPRVAALASGASASIDDYALGQLLLHRQHEALRDALRPLGLALYGDLQVGLSTTDVWALRPLLLPRYRMGAPPSRTNPLGQPWGYAVFDPALLEDDVDGGPGPAMRVFRARMQKALDEHDGVRLDHPHGLVCPWVYRGDEADLFAAVQHGARLRDSPGLADHPELDRYAIARREQLDLSLPRHADGWVRELDEAQVAQYARVFDELARIIGEGRCAQQLVCEVLSTQPYPLARVMARLGLGRFRVTQKADLDDPRDVYRPENAAPEDWIMVGNHDTPPIWRLADDWRRGDVAARQAAHLARVLCSPPGRERFEAALRDDAGCLVHAKVAELFLSPAEHVMIFFADLFGLADLYNRPGVVDEDNWALRLPEDFEASYAAKIARAEALDLRAALALALRAAGGDDALAERLAQGSAPALRGLLEATAHSSPAR